jgi:hypothetical protein
MENRGEELHELYKEELRKQLEKRVKDDWGTVWSDFGKYRTTHSGRGSKFDNALAAAISNKAKVGMSGATLKRFIFNEKSTKGENLDLICSYLKYNDYADFKAKNVFAGQREADYQDYFQVDLPIGKGGFQVKLTKGHFAISLFILAILALTSVVFFLPGFSTKENINSGNHFRLLHRSGKKSPAVYYLGVDLSGVVYDSAYVSFNIKPRERNVLNDQKRLLVSNPTDTLEYVVYKPEIIYAQLIVDGESYGAIRLITYSDDWDGHYSSILPETNAGWEDPLAIKEAFWQEGKLQYQRDYIHNAKHRGYFYANFMKVADFGINLSDAELLFNVRNSAKYGGISCFDVSIHIFDDLGNTFNYCLKREGCAIYTASFNGKPVPLNFEERDKLTQDLDEWADVKLRMKDKNVDVYINDEYRATLPIPERMGKLIEVKVDVKGMGEINYVDLKDSEGNAYYEDFGAVLKE